MEIMEKVKNFIISPELLMSAIAFGLAILVWTIFRKFFMKLMERKNISGKKANNFRMTLSIIKYTIFLIAIMIILEIYGINVTALVASIGVAGVVVGFALQDMLKDIIMGTNIVMDDYFSVGDIVSYGTISLGEVTAFSLKATRILDLNTGNTVIISNRSISEITKVSDWQVINVPAPYEESRERMRKVCLAICEEAEKNEKIKGCTFIGTGEFEDSSVIYKLRVISEPFERLAVKRVVYGIIQDEFERERIEIPYSQMDVHLDIISDPVL